MACFFYVVLFAFFLLSSHLFARQFPNEERFPTHNMKANVLKGSTNNLQWRIPLTPSKAENDHYTTSHRDYNVYPPILGMLFLRRRPSSRHTRSEQPSRLEKFREVFDWYQGQFEWFEGRISEWFNGNSERTPPNEEQGSIDNIGPSIGYNPYYSGYQTSRIEDSVF
ncbi:hypothetical protein PIB30_035451 [Stylosanthes scabra]|uniref:Uncharacterized protein n=1 Tax=Stylosanthes scabra TaxID=79078 RepID=A0ABU6UF36_9FABA|nr:hypothetical protein [Stylosanthes scabra]